MKVRFSIYLSINIYENIGLLYVLALLPPDEKPLPQQELAGRHEEEPAAQHEGTILYRSIYQYIYVER